MSFEQGFVVRETGGGTPGKAHLASVSAPTNEQRGVLLTLSPCGFPSNKADLSGGE